MSDENDNILNELPEEEGLPEFPSEDGGEDYGEGFFADDIDPTTIVTIRPGSGQPKYQTVAEPTPLDVILQRAGLTWNGQLDAYVEGQPKQLLDLIQGGQTVTLIGNVKGG
jgi:hypothetical protein